MTQTKKSTNDLGAQIKPVFWVMNGLLLLIVFLWLLGVMDDVWAMLLFMVVWGILVAITKKRFDDIAVMAVITTVVIIGLWLDDKMDGIAAIWAGMWVWGSICETSKELDKKTKSNEGKEQRLQEYDKRLEEDPNFVWNYAPKFDDPRQMTRREFMEFLGYDPDDPQDRLAAKDDNKPDDVLFDDEIIVWRNGGNRKCTVNLDYNGGTVDGTRTVDLLELRLRQFADDMEFLAFCHVQNDQRHFVLDRIERITFNGVGYTAAEFCTKILRVTVYDYVDGDERVCFMEHLNGIGFNLNKHYNSSATVKEVRKIRRAKK